MSKNKKQKEKEEQKSKLEQLRDWHKKNFKPSRFSTQETLTIKINKYKKS